MKKKILLNIGSLLTTLTPVSAIIACSPGSSMGEEESKFLSALESSDGVRKINNIWLDKALKELYSNDTNVIQSDLKKYIEFFIAEEIRKDNKYLTELNKKWSSALSGQQDKDKRDKLISDYSMGQQYRTFLDWKDNFKNGKTFEDFISEYLFNDDSLGEKHQISVKTDFLVNVKKALIVKKYLGIKKDDWMSVFGKEDDDKIYDTDLDSNKDVWDVIDNDEFPLILEGMRKHYAYSWNIQIKDKDEVYKLSEKEGQYIDAKPGEEKAETMSSQFKEDQELGKLSNRSESLNKAINDYSVLNINGLNINEDLAQYVGYQGIKALPQGKGSLNFKWDDIYNWKWKTSKSVFKGFVEKDELKNGDDIVKYAEPGASEINLTWFNGIGLIPTYDSTSTKIKFEDMSADKKENLYWTFINQNKTLYEKAVQYYTNKENPIQLDASADKFLEKKLIDMGIKFIKESKEK